MTKLNYLDNTRLFESKAVFVEVKEGDKGKAVILDETIFYPQGGGQPADNGEIVSEDAVFSVTDVRLDEDGVVWHFGEFENREFHKRDKVTLEIDKKRRILNAKLHSAGHLLDCAVKKIGIKNFKPIKGFHFSGGPYVEYEGTVENPADLIIELEKTINELIARDLEIEKADLSQEEAKARGIPVLPGKSARVINFAGFQGHGCGGTHVVSSSEIGKVIIRKIKSKKGMTKISYGIE